MTDLCVLASAEPVLAGLVETFDKLGFILQRAQPYSWKIFHAIESEEILNKNYTHRYPFCDVFVMRKSEFDFEFYEGTLEIFIIFN